jgi:hypothetical protein
MENKEIKNRQIIIETDGRHVIVKKAEVMSEIEFIGILNCLFNYFNSKRN